MGELEAEINRIRQTYSPLNTPVSGPDGALLLSYMRHHEAMEDAEEVHGEMRTIEIRHNRDVYRAPNRPICDQYQITVVFADGYAEPFSYKTACNNFGQIEDDCAASRRRLRWINRAARILVQDDIREHLNHHLETEGVCEISGRGLTRINAEAHHAEVSFKWLLFNFLRDYCLTRDQDPNQIEVLDTDLVGGKRFADMQMCDAWVEYHCSHAVVQILDGEIHRQQHKGQKSPPWGELFRTRSEVL